MRSSFHRRGAAPRFGESSRELQIDCGAAAECACASLAMGICVQQQQAVRGGVAGRAEQEPGRWMLQESCGERVATALLLALPTLLRSHLIETPISTAGASALLLRLISPAPGSRRPIWGWHGAPGRLVRTLSLMGRPRAILCVRLGILVGAWSQGVGWRWTCLERSTSLFTWELFG